MRKQQLVENIKKKESFLCVGLDTDISKIPDFLHKDDDPVFSFNKKIIDATVDLVICYKPNTAFYESMGLKGWKSLEKTIQYIKTNYPEIFIIADAKRGDIGNTSKMYAKAFLQNMDCDAITVSPYMGQDSVEPFLSIENKWVIILALTSNKGSFDFQQLSVGNEMLFEKVLRTSLKWGNDENLMYVVGATKAEELKKIRKIIPNHFLLIPGVGAQGGNLQDVANNGMNHQCGLIVNASRSVIYAGSDKNFEEKAYNEALKIQQEMSTILREKNYL